MKKRKNITKAVSALCTVTIILSAFAGCTKKSAVTTSTNSANTPPRKISIMTVTFGENPPADNFLLKGIQEATNTELEINWVPNSNYEEKVNVNIAANELPNAMLITNTTTGPFLGAAQQGAFWEISPYLKDFPIYLANYDKIRLDNSAIDGKYYGLPRYRPIGRNGYVYRKDWLDNLGLPEPKTVDDLYNMFKAFALNDPDKNGKNDTIGGALDKKVVLAPIIAPFGGANEWFVDKDGKVLPDIENKEYLEALKFVRRLYSEKLINQDFSVAADSAELFRKGNVGIRMGGVNDDSRSLWAELKQSSPDYKIGTIYNLSGPGGSKTLAYGTGFNGMYVFPKSSNKSEADLKAVLAFFDKMCDPKVVNLTLWGKEGEYYSLQDGKAVRSDEQAAKWTRDSYSISQIALFNDTSSMKNAIQSANERDLKAFAMWGENEKKGFILNPVSNLISPTYSTNGVNLKKIILDTKVKYIIGLIDEDGIKKEMEKFYNGGGDKVCKEYTELYAKSKK